jgi:hypothetical protein
MQLNVYVPRGRETVVERLDRVVQQLHRNKNDVVLDALENKVLELENQLGRAIPEFLVYQIGAGEFRREDLYGERL